MSTFLEITSACQTIQEWAAADTSHRVAVIFVGEFRNLGLKRIDALIGQHARAITTLVAAAKKPPMCGRFFPRHSVVWMTLPKI